MTLAIEAQAAIAVLLYCRVMKLNRTVLEFAVSRVILIIFTYCSKLSRRTNAFKAIDFVFTGSAITARGRVAVVDVDFTNWSCEAACTRAKKPAVSVYARTSIMTRVGCTVVLTLFAETSFPGV